MITVDNIALKWSYTYETYQTTARMRLSDGYTSGDIQLTDEQTAQLIASIMNMIRENVSVKHVAAPDAAPAIEEAAPIYETPDAEVMF